MIESTYFKCAEDGFFPDKTDCWVYHICDGGTHSVRACEEDLFFNSKTGLCDWPMNVECKQAKKPPIKHTTRRTTTRKKHHKINKNKHRHKNDEDNDSGNENGQDDEDDNFDDESTDLGSSGGGGGGDGICSEEDYGYHAHPKDCRKYIYCQEGSSKMFTCQGGLLWKQSDGNCVWPLDSDCPSLKKNKKKPKEENNDGAFNYGSGGGGANAVMGSKQLVALLKKNYGSIQCPADATGFFPNPFDCSAYHFCAAGQDQVILCEPGLQYRQDKQVCDWPVNAKCAPRCPANKSYRFIDPKSCCRYYECINGRLVIQLCQYPLLFDTNTKQCLDYSKVKCGIRRDCTSPCHYFTNEDASLCEMVPQCNNKPQGVYLDQNRPACQFFYTCRDNRVFNHTRCSANLRFNQYEGRCMPKEFVKCDANKIRPFHIISLSLFLIIYTRILRHI